MGYFASHMTYIRQTLANSAKDPIPGRASTGRPGTKRCAPLSTCSTCAPRSAGRARPIDASPASPERLLRFPRPSLGPSLTQATWVHR